MKALKINLTNDISDLTILVTKLEQFFEENKEAVYFNTQEELLQKIKYYLVHKDERAAIAEAGYKKCFNAGYTHKDRLLAVVKKIMNLN